MSIQVQVLRNGNAQIFSINQAARNPRLCVVIPVGKVLCGKIAGYSQAKHETTRGLTNRACAKTTRRAAVTSCPRHTISVLKRIRKVHHRGNAR